MSGYVIWRHASCQGYASLNELRGMEQTFRLSNGTPLERAFPQDVSLHMDLRFPDEAQLVDNMLNQHGLIVASSRLQAFLAGWELPCVEYLPVAIIGIEGEVASSDYFIVHPTDPVDCLDEARSAFTRCTISEQVDEFQRMVLDEARIPEDRLLFRLKAYWDATLVRRDLADALRGENFSGLGWLEVGDYPPE